MYASIIQAWEAQCMLPRGKGRSQEGRGAPKREGAQLSYRKQAPVARIEVVATTTIEDM